MAELTDIRETVRERYAAAARAAAANVSTSCCGVATTNACGEEVFGGALYTTDDVGDAPEAALNASLGCGVPTAVADLHEGETVLDLGSGAGADVLISARRVGATGRAIGLDMTDEMLALARANAAAAGLANVEFVKGHIEDIPLAGGSVDVVISNCVINLSGDKPKVLREAARVLRPGGRFAVSDVIADPGMDEATRADMAQWTGCIAGALTEEAFRSALAGAGFVDVEIRPTHRVHEHAASAIVRAPQAGMTCALDTYALAEQLGRLTSIGRHALWARRLPTELTVMLHPDLDDTLLHEALEIEAGCCPFFSLIWDEDGRKLTVVGGEAHQPILDRIADALVPA